VVLVSLVVVEVVDVAQEQDDELHGASELMD